MGNCLDNPIILLYFHQDPVIFSGSVRFNIDPAGEHTDHQVWTAIGQAHLRDFVASLPEGIMYECGEDGENFR